MILIFLLYQPMATYETVKASAIFGKQILGKLQTNPLSLINRDNLNLWLASDSAENKLVWPVGTELNLSGWINTLSPIESAIFYYSVATTQYQTRFIRKRKGPLVPIGNTLGLVSLGAGAIVVGAVGGVVCGAGGGLAVTGDAISGCRSGLGVGATAVVGGPLLIVSGAALGGVGGTLLGVAVAVPCVIGASIEATFGVVKSVVVWPTTPFEKMRSDRLRSINQMLLGFFRLIDHDGDFNENYQKVLGSAQSMGPALYDLFTQVRDLNSGDLTESVIAFLQAFRELVINRTLVQNGRVFRKVDHIKNLVACNLGNPIQSYHKIISNAGPSYVAEWIKYWTKEQRKADRAKQEASGISAGVQSTFPSGYDSFMSATGH